MVSNLTRLVLVIVFCFVCSIPSNNYAQDNVNYIISFDYDNFNNENNHNSQITSVRGYWRTPWNRDNDNLLLGIKGSWFTGFQNSDRLNDDDEEDWFQLSVLIHYYKTKKDLFGVDGELEVELEIAKPLPDNQKQNKTYYPPNDVQSLFKAEDRILLNCSTKKDNFKWYATYNAGFVFSEYANMYPIGIGNEWRFNNIENFIVENLYVAIEYDHVFVNPSYSDSSEKMRESMDIMGIDISIPFIWSNLWLKAHYAIDLDENDRQSIGVKFQVNMGGLSFAQSSSAYLIDWPLPPWE